MTTKRNALILVAAGSLLAATLASGSAAGPAAHVRPKADFVLKIGDAATLFASQLRTMNRHRVLRINCSPVKTSGPVRCADTARTLRGVQDFGVRVSCATRNGFFKLHLKARLKNVAGAATFTRTIRCTGYP